MYTRLILEMRDGDLIAVDGQADDLAKLLPESGIKKLTLEGDRYLNKNRYHGNFPAVEWCSSTAAVYIWDYEGNPRSGRYINYWANGCRANVTLQEAVQVFQGLVEEAEAPAVEHGEQ